MGRSKSSVCKCPFITAAALPSRTIAQALAATASSLPCTSIISKPDRSSCNCSAARLMASALPIRIGTITDSRAASNAPARAFVSVGQTTAIGKGCRGLTFSSKCSKCRCLCTTSPGKAILASICVEGALTSASPLTIKASSTSRCTVVCKSTSPSACFSITFTRQISSSPAWACS